MKLARFVSAVLFCGALLSGRPSMAQEESQPLDLALPTENDAIYRGGGPDFYQYIIRDFKGETSRPWEGGRYGFVRNPVETTTGLVYSRFHEGLDIRPLRRDANGEPLDEVRAIAAGTVVHVNLVAGYSNYGRYVVVEHRWGGANYYSLYGHLASASVAAGSKIARGDTLGVMGYTGAGLDRARAHLHLELNLLLSSRYEPWHARHFPNDPNRHGIYNGINLTGIDIARLYLELRKRPSLTMAGFLREEDTFYRVTFPASSSFDLPKRYPWLSTRSTDTPPPSWEVSFNRAGIPLKAAPGTEAVTAPQLSYFKKSKVDYSHLTRGVLQGSGDRALLSESGQRLMQLLSFSD